MDPVPFASQLRALFCPYRVLPLVYAHLGQHDYPFSGIPASQDTKYDTERAAGKHERGHARVHDDEQKISPTCQIVALDLDILTVCTLWRVLDPFDLVDGTLLIEAFVEGLFGTV